MSFKGILTNVNRLRNILTQHFEFNGIIINVCYASRATHGKSWVINTHYHPWYEFNYVSKGSVYTTTDGKEFLVEAGMSYMIPPGIPHSHRNNNTGDDGVCIRFGIDERTAAKDIKSVTDTLSLPHAAAFDSHIEMLNLNGNVYSIQAGFAAWLMQLSDTWSSKTAHICSDTEDILSHQVILYLDEYYNTKIKVNDIAAALNTSYRSLSRKFKAETGKSISDTLAEIRINKAKKLLLTTAMSMYDVAAAVGYENEFYFSRKFKQHEGVPPANYRNSAFK